MQTELKRLRMSRWNILPVFKASLESVFEAHRIVRLWLLHLKVTEVYDDAAVLTRPNCRKAPTASNVRQSLLFSLNRAISTAMSLARSRTESKSIISVQTKL